MGGQGSGRRPADGIKRRIVADMPSIVLADLTGAGAPEIGGLPLKRRRVLPGRRLTVKVERVREHTFRCTLISELINGNSWSQEHTLRLAPVLKQFGGCEFYLVCPACADFAKTLYVDGLMLRCRGCAKLVYRSQRQTAQERRRERLCALELLLGVPDGRGRPRRPAGMRQKRFEGLLSQLMKLRAEVAEADAQERDADIERLMKRKAPGRLKISTVDDSTGNDVPLREVAHWCLRDHREQRLDRRTDMR